MAAMAALATVVLLAAAPGAHAHGRLIEPPSRGSMWRYGFATPPDYNDHELYCGGFSRQWQTNGGRCGVCGDPWDSPEPRAHEAGGKYGSGGVVRRYLRGALVTLRIELTANHRGHFEFRLCPNNAPRRRVAQACLDRHLLARAATNETRYYPGEGNRVFEARYQLPAALTCTQCVLQWRYVAANNWGVCANGTGAVGCGPQEEFRACADVAIADAQGSADETPYVTDADDANDVDSADGDSWTPPRWLLLALVAGSLQLVAVVLALLYIYFYHAGPRVKRWLRATPPPGPPPVPPPRVKKQPC